ncbi:hypothetical protein H261_06439 [Paramagnetospirillum caucaseum]|uniref:Uncharacterized protein n=1 Tax=Paramagnetospirillum caucaseum TaxID=1244869 RepID=M3ADI6_9PROT|nr:hypothetical protein [Paramagnetospirillum caucaseum]EME70848.1 hypothetical protein H261_06439 [Paramagnetospirillum caucaseum]
MNDPQRLIRTVTLSLAPDADGAVIAGLALPEGILDLQTAGNGRVAVTYDLRHVTLPAIERWAAANRLKLSASMAARLRRRWLAFKDDNRRDQAAIVHRCCSVPPGKD